MSLLKKICLMGIVLFTSIKDTYCQKIMIGHEVTNRALTWEDFQGPPDLNSPYYAVTFWSMDYNMRGIKTYGDSVHIDHMEVILTMDPKKSWCNKAKLSNHLLKHEQGHFDIGKLCLKEFLTIYQNTSFRKKDVDATMKNIFYKTMAKYDELGKQYDHETEHSQNNEAQQYWNTFFSKYLID